MKKLLILLCLNFYFVHSMNAQTPTDAASMISMPQEPKKPIVGVKSVKNTPTTNTQAAKKERLKRDSSYKAWYAKAWYESDDGKSIEYWGQLIALFPDSSRPYQARGFVYNRIGKYDEAIRDCDIATTMDKNYALAFQLRGIANIGREKWCDAIADFNIALRIDNKLIKSYMYRGKAYAKINKSLSCCSDFNKAHDLASAVKDGSQDSLIRELKELISCYCINKTMFPKP